LSSIHPWAQKASEAAECADEQGKFWEYHDAIYDNQTTITQTSQTGGVTAAVDALKGLAPGLGLDAAAFNECLDSDKYASEVGKDVEDGTSYGVQGTPAFFINGLLVPGAVPFANFKAAIDAALAG
jgi:protein-disulfide isomerase